jgi:hypothetical protein
MTKENDYRNNAAETIELASRAASSADKGHLLALAEKWLDPADRAQSADSSAGRGQARRRATAIAAAASTLPSL